MKRNISIDIAKGICIICMIIVHFFSWWGKYDNFNKYVGDFFLVFFFVVSGFFFKYPTDKRKYIYKRVKKLLIPYIIIVLVYLSYICLYGKRYINYNVWENIKIMFASLVIALPMNFENIPIFHQDTIGIGPIWFLNALFVTNMIYLVISRNKYKLQISFVLAIIGQITQKFYVLPFNIQVAFIGCMFFAIGDCERDKINQYINILKEKSLRFDLGICFCEIIVYYFTINYLPHQWMNLGANSYNIISIISTILGIIILLSVSIIIEKTEIIDKFLSNYGKDSMFILILHNIDILMLRNWSNCSWEFLAATILGYYFINDLRNNILVKTKSLHLKMNFLNYNDSKKIAT